MSSSMSRVCRPRCRPLQVLSPFRAAPAPASSSAPIAPLHTTAPLAAVPAKKKPSAREAGPKYRESRSVVIKRKQRSDADMRPLHAIGELRAKKELLPLKNQNALSVMGLKEMDLNQLTQESDKVRGRVFAIPKDLVDPLANAKIFKRTQRWGLFNRPGILVTDDTIRLAGLMENITAGKSSRKSISKIVTGRKGAGKSLYLLQAATLALMQKWVVISLPEAQELVNGHTAYAPLNDTQPTQYTQKDATAQLLHRIATANASVLSSLHVSRHHHNIRNLSNDTTLQELALMGSGEPNMSWQIFTALWTELKATAPSVDSDAFRPFKPRPPLLLTADDIPHWMKDTAYRDLNFNPIHAHDLTLVRLFLDHLQPNSLPNGGMTLLSSSSSNVPSTPAFSCLIQQLAARAKGINPVSPDFPLMDVYRQQPVDDRVLGLLAKHPELENHEVERIDKNCARGLLEYYALSGLMRERVDETSVAEKWALSGGGVVGELEKLGLRLATATGVNAREAAVRR